MNQYFNSAKDYFDKMRQEGRIKLIHDSAASQAMLVEMNEELEKMRLDFLMKEGRSMNEAKSIVINA
ncbi:hypothetical protein [Algoriphagus antarcticus]|uniref:Uncharacterized protein n=1 Tax=Algoriphagus antarcticus TaxID=238540 RepID=A0A3E0D6U4_9BACT|nr:hypothetical protein [Algoriphagus antarcticus]REG78213.1 hypothetical protein C8N25_1395 [Algoriphagus antarcticus]